MINHVDYEYLSSYDLVVDNQLIAILTVTSYEPNLDIDEFYDDGQNHGVADALLNQIANNVFSLTKEVIKNYDDYTESYQQFVVKQCNNMIEKGWSLKISNVQTNNLVTVESLLKLIHPPIMLLKKEINSLEQERSIHIVKYDKLYETIKKIEEIYNEPIAKLTLARNAKQEFLKLLSEYREKSLSKHHVDALVIECKEQDSIYQEAIRKLTIGRDTTELNKLLKEQDECKDILLRLSDALITKKDLIYNEYLKNRPHLMVSLEDVRGNSFKELAINALLK